MASLVSGKNNNDHSTSSSAVLPQTSDNVIDSRSKRKRRPAGTPDPDAEVVSLSPKTLLESDRYVCEICNQGFQRDQNLQMHRRRHKVPWKLLKRETPEVKKRVFVCPEPTCLHHDPGHALGDLVGIKKHYRRKHSDNKQWVCARCSKAYAVQSDYKAHLKTCGTRGHSCDCGRVFSRVESFIEHQDACTTGRPTSELNTPPPMCLSRTTSSSSPSSDTNLSNGPGVSTWQNTLQIPTTTATLFNSDKTTSHHFHTHNQYHPHLELQLLPPSSTQGGMSASCTATPSDNDATTHLHLSVGSPLQKPVSTNTMVGTGDEAISELLKRADDSRRQAKRRIDLAEQELASARRLRQQAQAEMAKAQILRDHAFQQINNTLLEITCHSCKHKYMRSNNGINNNNNNNNNNSKSVVFPTALLDHPNRNNSSYMNTTAGSYVSSVIIAEGEGDNHLINGK